jgi:hypothetical protein
MTTPADKATVYVLEQGHVPETAADIFRMNTPLYAQWLQMGTRCALLLMLQRHRACRIPVLLTAADDAELRGGLRYLIDAYLPQQWDVSLHKPLPSNLLFLCSDRTRKTVSAEALAPSDVAAVTTGMQR